MKKIDTDESKSNGIGILSLALLWGIITQVLACCGILDWNWIPIWLPSLIVAAIIIVLVLIAFILTGIFRGY